MERSDRKERKGSANLSSFVTLFSALSIDNKNLCIVLVALPGQRVVAVSKPATLLWCRT